MEAILFIGVQAAGKSTFFRERFADTHVRINLDMLRTRHREQRLIETCLAIEQPFVVDNTNPTREDRARYFAMCRDARVTVRGYYFASRIDETLERNAARPRPIPERGVRATHARLEIPTLDEGFAELAYVAIASGGTFDVKPWNDEV